MSTPAPHPITRPTARALSAVASGGGALLAAGVRVVAAARPSAKPLHPRGRLRHATLVRHGARTTGAPRTAVAWLDEPGSDDAWVRTSRAVGLPAPAPDVHGLALRLHLDDGPADVLLASTGRGRLTRWLLTAGVDPWARPQTSLVPYRSPVGPLVLGARRIGGPDDAPVVELSWAQGTGPWHAFAELRITGRDVTGADGDAHRGHAADAPPDVSFDPVLRVVPGLGHYRAVTRLREPAYRTARAQRDD